MRFAPGGQVARVVPGSLADEAGLRAGDRVLSVNGHILRDVIDYRFYAAEDELEIVFRRQSDSPRAVHIQRNYGHDLGLEFTAPTFDGIRPCRNRCDFCFIHQMPPGLRPSLYVKDDDYRYSFLYGNFITLTNLEQADWERLAEQRLSPLYVSVHATDPTLRAAILGVKQAPDILTQIRRLGDLGITVHAQIVIIPDINDGSNLEQTVRDLASLWPHVASIGLVPVGLTRYHRGGFRTVTQDEAKDIVAWAERMQRHYRREHAVGLVYPSDEFYLLGEKSLPAARSYDGFPQLANGIGLTRMLLDDWRRAQRARRRAWPYQRVTLVCGRLIAPTLQSLVAEMASSLDAEMHVIPVHNAFFGATVTVSGLLTAEDVAGALRGKELGDLVALPRAMFDANGERTLDDRTPEDIARQLGVPVIVAERLSELLDPQLVTYLGQG